MRERTTFETPSEAGLFLLFFISIGEAFLELIHRSFFFQVDFGIFWPSVLS